LIHARDLKTLLGDTKRKSVRLALGFEPDLRKLISPVLQGRPLFRGRLFRKVHSAPPPLKTNHYGQGNRLENVAMSRPAPVHRAASPAFFRSGMVSRRLPSNQLAFLIPRWASQRHQDSARVSISGTRADLVLPLLCPWSYRLLPIVT